MSTHPQSDTTSQAQHLRRMTMTVREVTAALGLGRNTVYDLLQRGLIPAKRVGRRFIISRAVFEDWLRSSD